MSIWIRRQDKGLGKYMNFLPPIVEREEIPDPETPFRFKYGEVLIAKIIGYDDRGGIDVLGAYDTEDEALAVLDQIQNHINFYVRRNEPARVFQMPEAGFSRIPKEYRCVVCGVNPVDVDAGYDTCPTCAGRI